MEVAKRILFKGHLPFECQTVLDISVSLCVSFILQLKEPFAAKRGPGATFGKHFDLKKEEGIIEKNSYDQRVYESVDYIGDYLWLYLISCSKGSYPSYK